MGAVWKAWDKKLTRWVAIKFLLVSEDEDVMRFQREAKLAARLRHPNIAPIYEVGEAPATLAGQSARHYLAMEYIDGTTMAGATDFPIPELVDIFMKVAQGIEAAHKAGVVHRDLKPANVMLTTDKWPYVMDFGLAKAIQAESSLSVSGAVMGTPAYMPPEQAEGKLDMIDGQSDVYSLGATMYAVLCKKQPFTGQTPMAILMKVCKEDPPTLRSHNPNVPEELEKIVLKAMSKEKSDRYASAQALADDLKRYLSNQEIEAKGPSSPRWRPSRPSGTSGRSSWERSSPPAARHVAPHAAPAQPIEPPPVVVVGILPVTDPPPEDTAGKRGPGMVQRLGPSRGIARLRLLEARRRHAGRAREKAPPGAQERRPPARHRRAPLVPAPDRQGGRRAARRPVEPRRRRGREAGGLVRDDDDGAHRRRNAQAVRRADPESARRRGHDRQLQGQRIAQDPHLPSLREITPVHHRREGFLRQKQRRPTMIGPVEISDLEVEFTRRDQAGGKIPASQLKDGRPTRSPAGSGREARS
jgi:serine/threonine protein kinase